MRPRGPKNPYVRFQKLDKPPVALHDTTLWDYPSQHYGKRTQGDPRYRGATPSHVIWNVLQRWSKHGDVVVDPFCGSGTTLDVCRDLGRTGRGFDVAPARDDVERADARALPLAERSAQLVFFDPPYADNLAYSDDPQCIGRLSAENGAWQAAMSEVLHEAARVLVAGGVCAVFLCDIYKVKAVSASVDRRIATGIAASSRSSGGACPSARAEHATQRSWQGPSEERINGCRNRCKGGKRTFLPLGLYLAAAAEDAGLVPIEHVAVVRHGKTLESGAGSRQAARDRFLLRGFSHLLVFEKRQRPC